MTASDVDLDLLQARPAKPGVPIADPAWRSVTDGIRTLLEAIVSAVLVVALAPGLLAIALAIRLEDGGPALFRQERMGRRQRSFTIYKFRTMTVNAPQALHQQEVLRQLSGDAAPLEGRVGFKPRSDPRVTRVGRVLRRYSLDELPQLLNVLRGEMAVVGPRPSLVWEADAFPAWAQLRYAVKPGLTGLWQVAGRNQLSMRQMLELDVHYIRTRSLWNDVVILLRTIPAVVTGRGAA